MDGILLIKKGACALVKHIAIHLQGKIGHAPKCVANTFMDAWKQTLVIRVIPCF